MLRAQVAPAALARLSLAWLAFACGDNDPPRPDAATEQEVAVFRAVPNHELDLMFVIDDTELDKQTNLKRQVGVLRAMLQSLDPPGYDVHIGVVSSDMGTVGSLDPTTPAPGIGSGPGSCWGFGKDGRLLTNATTYLPTGSLYVAERVEADGAVTTNYSGTFEQVMGAILSLGASGCGFEQPLAAMKRALENPANVGFRRGSANLAVIIFQEEDDCSVRDAAFFSVDTSILGPLQSFRCTRWGLQCNEDINVVGRKTGCRPWRESPYVDDVAPFVDALFAEVGDPRKLAVTSIMGPTEPIDVEPRTPPGGGTPTLALSHSCIYNGSVGPEVADPGKRLEAFLDAFSGRTSTAQTTICKQDLAPALQVVSAAIKKTLGDTCIDTRSLLDTDAAAPGIQPQCTAVDIRDSDPTPIDVPFELVVDATICPHYPEHLRFVPHRTIEPAADTWTHVRCKLAP